MKPCLIDTNVIISFVTDRNPLQNRLAASFFESASTSKLPILCHQHVISEFVYVMERVYCTEKTLIREILQALVFMPGLSVVHEFDYKLLCDLWPSKVNDYGDAVITAIAKAHKGLSVATFDLKLSSALERLHIPVHDWGI